MDPNKPQYDPAEKPYYADAPVGVPVASSHHQQQPMYPQMPGYVGPQQGYAAAPGQPAAVDAYGRPIVTATPMAAPPVMVVPNNAAIQRDAAGNALCKKCRAPYPLPAGCTSWRCRNCHTLNNASIHGDECCIIL